MAGTQIDKGDMDLVYDTLDGNPIDKKHKLTDVTSLITFCVFLILHVGIVIYAFNNGDYKKIQRVDLNFDFDKNVNSVLLAFSLFVLFLGLSSVLYTVVLRWIPGFFIYSAIVIEYLILTYFLLSSLLFPQNAQLQFKNQLLIIFCIVFAIVKLRVLKKVGIKLICEVIKESCRCILSFPSSILLVIFAFILKMLIFFFATYVYYYLTTIKTRHNKVNVNIYECYCPFDVYSNYKNNCDEEVFSKNCKPYDFGKCPIFFCQEDVSTPYYIYFFLAANIVFSFWLLLFVFHFCQMILSRTFATWYWTSNKETTPSFTILKNVSIITRYSLGTISFGTSPLVIFPIIYIMWKCLCSKLSEFYKQPLTMLFCWWNIFHKLSDSSLTWHAINGNGFYRSTKFACTILMRNPLKFFIINKAFEWLVYFLMTLLAILTTLFVWTLFGKETYNLSTDALTFIIMLTVIIILIATGPVILLLYGAINTCFLCLLVDSESSNFEKKTYHMNSKLIDLLIKE